MLACINIKGIFFLHQWLRLTLFQDLYFLAVRGKGVGTELIKWAIQRAEERGCHLVQLTTDKKRPDALSFYERLGFKATHEGLKLKF
jgi:GNAT superfamily N-acetyltransferase